MFYFGMTTQYVSPLAALHSSIGNPFGTLSSTYDVCKGKDNNN